LRTFPGTQGDLDGAPGDISGTQARSGGTPLNAGESLNCGANLSRYATLGWKLFELVLAKRLYEFIVYKIFCQGKLHEAVQDYWNNCYGNFYNYPVIKSLLR
jgi:hypothetical protein